MTILSYLYISLKPFIFLLGILGGVYQFSSVQLLSRVRLFATPWIAAHQASLSITNSWSLLKLMSIELVMPSSHLILCRPLLLLRPIPPSIRVFSNESTLRIRWPKYWSFSFSISPSNEHPGLISFRMDWLCLFAVQGTLKRGVYIIIYYYTCIMSLSKLQEIVKDREAWHAAIHGVRKSRTWPSDWTTVCYTLCLYILLLFGSKATLYEVCKHKLSVSCSIWFPLRHLLLGYRILVTYPRHEPTAVCHWPWP